MTFVRLLSAAVCLELRKKIQGWNQLEVMPTNIEHAGLYMLLMRSLNLGVRMQGLCEAVVQLVALCGRSLTGVVTSSGSYTYQLPAEL